MTKNSEISEKGRLMAPYSAPAMRKTAILMHSMLCLSGENAESYVLGTEEGLWDEDPEDYAG